VLTSLSARRRSIVGEWSNDVEATDRYVDIGVTLRVVRAEPIPGAATVEYDSRALYVVREHFFGGILDTKSDPPRILEGDAGVSQNPRVWLCSEDQERAILHGDHETTGLAAIGGMGAGKTTAGVMWLYLRWLEHLGERREGGVIGPTEDRLEVVFKAMFDLFAPNWYSYSSGAGVLTFCDGTRVRGVSTYRQSSKQGSRIQAFNWSFLLADELQDSIDEFINAQARLRSGKKGNKKRLATVTAKDDPAWRDLQDKMRTSEIWTFLTMLGPRSPFIDQEHWAVLRKQTTDRDYRRLVLAEDLPSESRVYNCFDRSVHLRMVPLGARKITSLVIGKKIGGEGWGVGIGHDPGVAKAGSVWFDAYDIPRQAAALLGCPTGEPIWFARAELFTHQDTPEQHAVKAMAKTREVFGCNIRPGVDRAHVRCQPLGTAEDTPDTSTLATWRRIGFDIRVAKYNKNGDGKTHIKKNDRITVVNTLFDKRRLFLECDDRGVCRTPQLLAAIETMERDHMGRAEHEAKNVKHDRSDLPAAAGYWLYPFEKELASALQASIRGAL
jgi:hypothetical protein